MINLSWICTSNGDFVLKPYIRIDILKEIVNIEEFYDFARKNFLYAWSHGDKIKNLEEVPLNWYLEYYDKRSIELASENQLSRGVTVASSKKLEGLNNADALKEYREKFAHVDFD